MRRRFFVVRKALDTLVGDITRKSSSLALRQDRKPPDYPRFTSQGGAAREGDIGDGVWTDGRLFVVRKALDTLVGDITRKSSSLALRQDRKLTRAAALIWRCSPASLCFSTSGRCIIPIFCRSQSVRYVGW